jgi:hypothetical protein
MAPTGIPLTDDDIARRLSTFLASTPPDSDHHSGHSTNGSGAGTEPDFTNATNATETSDSLWAMQHGSDAKFSLDSLKATDDTNMFADGAIMVGAGDFEPDFDSMINLDALGSFDEAGYGVMQGESGGFALDMDWMNGVGNADGLGGEGMGDVMV